LPRILAGVDRDELNRATMNHFGLLLIETGEDEWLAIDGKALCGTPDAEGKQKARIVTAVNHESRETVAQCEMNSAKKGEITAVRTFLQESGLEKANVTLDALHMNPKTTAQIHQAGGHYLIQLKSNQSELCQILTSVASTATPASILNYIESGHGRQEERWYWCFDLQTTEFDERWQNCGLNTLVVVMRQTATGSDRSQLSLELSYYLSNWSLAGENAISPEALARTVRRHWGVESVNWIRDVTFQEDKVKTKDHQLAQCMATIRSFALRLLQRAHFPNFQAAIERFVDCSDDFFSFLQQAQLL
jgi:predicted transposase YbfD/YdcC